MIKKTTKRWVKSASKEMELIISGGNAYGIKVSTRYRDEYDKDKEQPVINLWNGAMGAEFLQKSKVV